MEYYLGEGTSFNIKEKFPNTYSNLTISNFIISYGNGSYNADTGILTITNNTISGSSNYSGVATYWGSTCVIDSGIQRCGGVVSGINVGYSGTAYWSHTLTPKAWLVFGKIK